MPRDRIAPRPHDASPCLNPSGNTSFGDVVGTRMSRREALRRGSFAAAFTFLPGVLTSCGDDAPPDQGTGNNEPPLPAPELALDFAAVPKGLDDFIRVPAGYTAFVLTSLGDPIDAATSEYANDGSDGDFAHRIGDHGDAAHRDSRSARRQGRRLDVARQRGTVFSGCRPARPGP